ncbi:hypothetical protein BN13_900010 [Nostocoides jenkinsii Ben 74]|uniref:Uncharacterized protein n=1 Tax=Nostocoides jenkinsii Ben 74 TaxID=1193518 RepID=A0A077ME66_9MICO|nr:hypothetical protein BN13_900010 [Tetrasphaera jenkinsii Ben 74]
MPMPTSFRLVVWIAAYERMDDAVKT